MEISRTENPKNSVCTVCFQEFGSYELTHLYIDKFADENNVDKDLYSADYVDKRSCKFELLDLDKPLDMIVYCLALVQLQYHYWHHTKSCFKVTTRTPSGLDCRSFYPRLVQLMKTHYNKLYKEMILVRNIGSQYTNGFLKHFFKILRNNHDFQVIFKKGRNVCFYIMKYSVQCNCL